MKKKKSTNANFVFNYSNRKKIIFTKNVLLVISHARSLKKHIRNVHENEHISETQFQIKKELAHVKKITN